MATLTALALAATTALSTAAAPAEPIKETLINQPGRAAAVAHWTPERMKTAGQDSADRVERVAKPWTGATPAGVGRLFANQEPGGASWCSATAVAKDVVITAAHCLWPGYTREGDVIRTKDIVFAPGYDRGPSALGVFPARAWVIQQSYVEHSSPDVAFVVLDPVQGKHVGDRAGTQRLSFDEPEDLATTILGYPGSKAAYGEQLFRCAVTAKREYRWTTGCDMAGGSSGGPWLAGFHPATGKGTVYSVTSKGALEIDESTGELHTTSLDGTVLSPADRPLLTRAEGL